MARITTYGRRISSAYSRELASATVAKSQSDAHAEFTFLERAHVLGQASTWLHVKAHVLMAAWAIRNRSTGEFAGQLLRIFGAATKTVFGLVPSGNTGGANISPFKRLPIAPDLAAEIARAQQR
jgi:Protein of unknown function (DUF3703)